MRGLLIDVINNEVKEVSITEYTDYYPLIQCETFDIVDRGIGDQRFNLVCDDEGLLKPDPVISVLDQADLRMLVGNIVVTGPVDINGDLESLSDQDIQLIKSFIEEVSDFGENGQHPVLTRVKY